MRTPAVVGAADSHGQHSSGLMGMMKRAGFASIAAVLALAGCGGQPIWQSEPPQKPAPAAAQEAAPPPEPEPPTVVEQKPAPVAKPEPAAPRRAAQVQAGITAYDNGNHKEAARLLRAALRAHLSAADQVEARKYLAFVECSANRRTQCRDEFRRALRIDPSFDLTPAEAGHPIWGPVFREVKQQQSKQRR